MKTLFFAIAFLASFSASAAVIEAKTELHVLASQPVAQMKSGTCSITGAVVVNGVLVNGADIGVRVAGADELLIRTKTNAKGVYTLAVKVKSGTTLQEIVISNADKAGKVAVFPGQTFVCK